MRGGKGRRVTRRVACQLGGRARPATPEARSHWPRGRGEAAPGSHWESRESVTPERLCAEGLDRREAGTRPRLSARSPQCWGCGRETPLASGVGVAGLRGASVHGDPAGPGLVSARTLRVRGALGLRWGGRGASTRFLPSTRGPDAWAFSRLSGVSRTRWAPLDVLRRRAVTCVLAHALFKTALEGAPAAISDRGVTLASARTDMRELQTSGALGAGGAGLRPRPLHTHSGNPEGADPRCRGKRICQVRRWTVLAANTRPCPQRATFLGRILLEVTEPAWPLGPALKASESTTGCLQLSWACVALSFLGSTLSPSPSFHRCDAIETCTPNSLSPSASGETIPQQLVPGV